MTKKTHNKNFGKKESWKKINSREKKKKKAKRFRKKINSYLFIYFIKVIIYLFISF
jgi:hypothetical protein